MIKHWNFQTIKIPTQEQFQSIVKWNSNQKQKSLIVNLKQQIKKVVIENYEFM